MTKPSKTNRAAASVSSSATVASDPKPSKGNGKPSKAPSVAAAAASAPQAATEAKEPKPAVPGAVVSLAMVAVALIDSSPNRDMGEKGEGGETLAELTASMKARGQITPVTLRKVGERYTVIAGRRRYAAAVALRWPQIAAKVIEGGNAKDDDLAAFAENFFRKPLSGFETALQIKGFLDSGLTGAQVHAETGMAQSLVNSYGRIIRNCIPAVLEAFKAGTIGVKDAIAYAGKTPKEQEEGIKKCLSADALRQAFPDKDAEKKRAEAEKKRAEEKLAFEGKVKAWGSSVAAKVGHESIAKKALAMAETIKDEKTFAAVSAFLDSLFSDGENDAQEAPEGTDDATDGPSALRHSNGPAMGRPGRSVLLPRLPLQPLKGSVKRTGPFLLFASQTLTQ